MKILKDILIATFCVMPFYGAGVVSTAYDGVWSFVAVLVLGFVGFICLDELYRIPARRAQKIVLQDIMERVKRGDLKLPPDAMKAAEALKKRGGF